MESPTREEAIAAAITLAEEVASSFCYRLDNLPEYVVDPWPLLKKVASWRSEVED